MVTARLIVVRSGGFKVHRTIT